MIEGLCLITDRKVSGMSAEEITAAALRAGAVCIQYREKEKSRRELYHEAFRLRGLTREAGSIFIVNDHADIAFAVGADGVHLGQDDLPLPEARKIMGDRIIGISTHSVAEAVEAEEGGADYIGFGPIFSTSTKDAGEPKGVDMLREIKGRVKIPVVAIGGISLENLSRVIDAGADGIAVASAILTGSIDKNVRSFKEAMGSKRREGRA